MTTHAKAIAIFVVGFIVSRLFVVAPTAFAPTPVPRNSFESLFPRITDTNCVSQLATQDDGFGSHLQTMTLIMNEAFRRRVPPCLLWPKTMAHVNATEMGLLLRMTGFEFHHACDCRWMYGRDFGFVDPVYPYFSREFVSHLQSIYTPRTWRFPFVENRTHVVVHVRVRNQFDVRDQTWDFDRLEKIMADVRNEFPGCLFHVISQTPLRLTERVFEKVMTKCTDCVLHLDLDTSVSFDMMVQADVLVTAESSFSHLAGWYNRNTVHYFKYHRGAFPWWRNVE